MSSLLEQSEEAYNDYQDLVHLIEFSSQADVMKGEKLWKLKANNAYKKAVGEGTERWEDFLAMPELGLTAREANRYMDIYEQFVVKLGYDVDEVSKAKTKSLHYLLPIVKDDSVNKNQIERLFEEAKTLPQKDFRERVHDIRHGGDTEDAPRTYTFMIMMKCNETGTLSKVHNIPDSEIREKFNLTEDD